MVSKTSLGQIQVMLTDGGNGDTAAEVANSLKKDFSGKHDTMKYIHEHMLAILKCR